MKTKLSHSSAQKYMTCPVAFDLHYNKRLRSKYHSAALCFGAAIDEALNELLMPTGKTAEEVFIKEWNHADINGIKTFLQTSTDVVYQNADMDADLLTEEDFNSLKEKSEAGLFPECDDYLELYRQLKDAKSKHGFDKLEYWQRVFFNYMNWMCVRARGLLMIDAYRRKILPRLTKIHAVQKDVILYNSDGDEIVGKVDLIANMAGVGTVILDNKTSAMAYDHDAVTTSAQLSLYVHCLEDEYQTREAGYIVMRKSVIKNRKKICKTCGHDGSGGRHETCNAQVNGKRCGGEWTETFDFDIFIQVITDRIPILTEEMVMDNFDQTNRAVKAGIYTRNFNSCHNSFGSKCIYFNYCYFGRDTGLVDMTKKDSDV